MADDRKGLKRAVAKRFFGAFPLLGVLFFLPAWTISYWQAWVYMLILFIPMTAITWYLYRNDPALLQRRMRVKEKQDMQKWVVVLAAFLAVAIFAFPGFDVRFGWSRVPTIMVVIGDILALTGYLFITLVFRVNSFASRTVGVDKGQKVIAAGPYAFVRHPMYLGAILLCVFTPLALGSYWGMPLGVFLVPVLVARIRGEEKYLLENLEGYREYVMKTKYRLVPGMW